MPHELLLLSKTEFRRHPAYNSIRWWVMFFHFINQKQNLPKYTQTVAKAIKMPTNIAKPIAAKNSVSISNSCLLLSMYYNRVLN
jgi:hypothetical protein